MNKYCWWLLGSFAMMGCGSAPISEPSDPKPQSGHSEGATTLHSSTFADGGELRIAADESGLIGVMVSAAIGSEAEELLRRAQATTVTELYEELHDGAPAPGDLVAISLAREAQQRELAASPEGQEVQARREAIAVDPPIEEPLNITTKDFNSFFNGYCKDTGNSSRRYIYRVGHCHWCDGPGCTSLVGNQDANATDSDGALIDRVYAWNASQFTAWIELRPAPANTWQPNVPPWSVSWIDWGGVYSWKYPRFHIPAGNSSEQGLVELDAEYKVP